MNQIDKVEQYLKENSDYTPHYRFDDCEYSWDSVIGWMESYAYQQTASLQKELEEQKINMGKMTNLWISEKQRAEALKKQVEELREENKRLKLFEEQVRSSQEPCALCGCSIDAHRDDFTCPDFFAGQFTGWLDSKFLVR